MRLEEIQGFEKVDKVAEGLLWAVRRKDNTQSYQRHIRELEFDYLRNSLLSHEQKLSFWINIYNAFYLILRLELNISKKKIYTDRVIEIAGRKYSLDDIEHGILRCNRYKYSMGLFRKPFTSSEIRRLSLDKLDYRIHFALNCGAKSCPPIALYTADKILNQLNLATQSFLEGDTHFDKLNNEVHISRLFFWYHYDFGGKPGIRSIYQLQLNKDIKGLRIRYDKYDWTDDLNNFITLDN